MAKPLTPSVTSGSISSFQVVTTLSNRGWFSKLVVGSLDYAVAR